MCSQLYQQHTAWTGGWHITASICFIIVKCVGEAERPLSSIQEAGSKAMRASHCEGASKLP